MNTCRSDSPDPTQRARCWDPMLRWPTLMEVVATRPTTTSHRWRRYKREKKNKQLLDLDTETKILIIRFDFTLQCVQVLGQNKGVCRDDIVGGQDSFQIHTHSRENGINTLTFRRLLISGDSGDKEFRLDREMYVVWAMGRLDSNKEPTFHDFYPKSDIIIHFNTSEPVNDCFSFTRSEVNLEDIWERSKIFDNSIRTFRATLGPAGGKRGYAGITGHVSNGLAWYVNGFMVPEMWLRRGLTYAFRVYGGNNPHSPEYYHPLVITDEPRGGFDRLTEAKQNEIRVLAGVEFTRRGRPKPTAGK